MIKLPILFNTDTTTQLEKLNIDVSYDDYEVRESLFMKIDVVTPNIKDGKNYTDIHASGDQFICALSIDEVEQLIKNQPI